MIKKIISKLLKKYQKSKQPRKIEVLNNKVINQYKIHTNDELKNVKLKIITSHDDSYNDIGNITKMTMSKYATKFNFDFEFKKMPVTGRAQTWNKIKLLKEELLKKNNDFIMWIDADAFFHNESENILSVLDKKHQMFLTSHYCSVHKGSNFKNTILTTKRLNAGVMIFKVSDFNIEFMDVVWNHTKFINNFMYEQAAIMDLIGLRADITGNLNENKGNEYYLRQIKFLPKEWNSIPSFGDISTESIKPSIIHLAGIENEERIKFLNDYKLKGKI